MQMNSILPVLINYSMALEFKDIGTVPHYFVDMDFTSFMGCAKIVLIHS